jgi:hypothetical protein
MASHRSAANSSLCAVVGENTQMTEVSSAAPMMPYTIRRRDFRL